MIDGSTSNCVKLTGDQTIAGNKIFTGTTSTMTLHTYNPLYVNNGTDNSKNTSLYTDTDGVFKIVNSSSSVKRPTYNGKGMALIDDLSSYLPLAGGTMTGDINLNTNGGFIGTTASGNKFDVFRLQNSTKLQVGGSYPELLLKGKNARPTYNGSEMALLSDLNGASDTKVTQDYSTANDSYPLLMTATNGITSTSSRGSGTAILTNNI